jgi:hypothetical protein
MANDPWSDEPELTARPNERPIGEADDEKLVPIANVGGAAPTSAGLDSGGKLPGREDDLANLAEEEPDAPPEVTAVSIREENEEKP